MEENSQSSKGDNLKVALKVVSKSSLKDRMHIDKVRREVAIHKSLNHDNVIKLLSFFEDNVNLYMVLELGVYGNLLSNIQASKTGHLSELVARSYMREIVGAVVYLHEVAGILHRDLKPGNILLGLKNQIKLADFGLAVKIADLAHVSRSLSGTPNYMSPEVLDSRGHSKESEAWALGCIFYCMLVGKAPFESESLEKTFYRIRQCDYFIPLKTRISERARGLIRRLLDPDVGRRLKVINIMRCDYFSNSSTVAMTNAPVAPANDPLSFVFAGYEASAIGSYQACVLSRDSGLGVDRMRTPRPDDPLLLLNWLMSGRIDVTNDPARPVSGNVLMVNKWVDYTNRYGFGCILSDGTECVQYTDGSLYAHRNAASYERERSQLVMNPNEMPLTVYEWASVSDVSDPLILRKIKLAALFSGYMHRELQSASPLVCTDICMNYLVYQRRGNGALVMVLSDRTTQINFLETHEKLVIRFDESGDISVIVIHPERGMHSYRMWVRTSPPALAENRRVYDLVMEARCRLGDHSSRPYYATEC